MTAVAAEAASIEAAETAAIAVTRTWAKTAMETAVVAATRKEMETRVAMNANPRTKTTAAAVAAAAITI